MDNINLGSLYYIKNKVYLVVDIKKGLWGIPISKNIKKYENIIKEKEKKYKKCSSIMIRYLAKEKVAILIQNAHPIKKEYLTPCLWNNQKVTIINKTYKEIVDNLNTLLALKNQGLNLFFTDIDNIKES